MRQNRRSASAKSGPSKPAAETVVKDIRRRTRKQHSAEEKIRIVLEGLRGEDSIAELCRREGIAASLDYSWSKEFLGEACAAAGPRPRRTARSGWPATRPVRPRRPR
jgi:CRISPR/Cas system-associated endonuclease Cas1